MTLLAVAATRCCDPAVTRLHAPLSASACSTEIHNRLGKTWADGENEPTATPEQGTNQRRRVPQHPRRPRHHLTGLRQLKRRWCLRRAQSPRPEAQGGGRGDGLVCCCGWPLAQQSIRAWRTRDGGGVVDRPRLQAEQETTCCLDPPEKRGTAGVARFGDSWRATHSAHRAGGRDEAP